MHSYTGDLIRHFVRRGESVEVVLYRIGALLLVLMWPLWLAQLVLTNSGPGGIFVHWYPSVTFVLFCTAELGLLIAWVTGRHRPLTVALRFCGVTLVIALILLLPGLFSDAWSYTGYNGTSRCLWFSGMTGIPAVAVALTVPPRVATAFFIPTVGTASLVDALLGYNRGPVFLVGAVGFGLVYSFYFVAVASTMNRLVHVIDDAARAETVERARASRFRASAASLHAELPDRCTRLLTALEVVVRGGVPADPVTDPVPSPDSRGDRADAPADPPLQKITGFDRVFSWPYLTVCAFVITLRMVSAGGPTDVIGIVTCSLLVGTLLLLGAREWRALPLWRALLVAGALNTAAVMGLWQGATAGPVGTSHWEFGAISLVAALTVTRGRATAGVVGVLVAVALLTVAHVSGLSPGPDNTGMILAADSIVVVAAVLLRRGVDQFVRQIPKAQRRYREARAGARAAETEFGRLRDHCLALDRAVRPVIDTASRVSVVSPSLARRAELTRLQIMDVTAAPHLAVPALQEAVWDARARGVTVTVVDDRPVGKRTRLNSEEISGFLSRSLPLVDGTEHGSVQVVVSGD